MTASARLNPMFGLYIRVMVATGARRAEVCALRWTDVDFTAGTLNVSRIYTVLPGIRDAESLIVHEVQAANLCAGRAPNRPLAV